MTWRSPSYDRWDVQCDGCGVTKRATYRDSSSCWEAPWGWTAIPTNDVLKDDSRHACSAVCESAIRLGRPDAPFWSGR